MYKTTRKLNHARKDLTKMAEKFYNRSLKHKPFKTLGVALGIGALSSMLWHQLRK